MQPCVWRRWQGPVDVAGLQIGWYVFGERVGPLFWLEAVLILRE